MNDVDELADYDPDRYDGWPLDRIVTALRASPLSLLKRASWASLIARREWGGLLIAASKLVTTLTEQTQLFRRVLDLNYTNARLHMKLWAFWPRIAKMLHDREESCRRRGAPFVVPGYERCLIMAGISGRMGPAIPVLTPPPPVFREPLPDDVAALTEQVEMLELQNRLEREKTVQLAVELDATKEELDELKIEKTAASPDRRWFSRLTGWVGSKRPRIIPRPQPDRPAEDRGPDRQLPRPHRPAGERLRRGRH